MTRAMLIILCLLTGCDRPPARTTSAAAQEPRDVPMRGEITSIAPLTPARRTHLAADSVGNVYFVQETESGNDILFICGKTGVPRATRLTSAAILDALGVAGAGKGSIQSIAATSDESIYFYFKGGQKRVMAACLGRYSPQDEKIQVLAATKQLAEASGMGASLELARGSVAWSEKTLWLWLRHSDAFALFPIRTQDIPNTGNLKLPVQLPAILIAGGTMPLTREEHELIAMPDGSLILSDRYGGALWRIDAAGSASIIQTLLGLPSQVSTPTVHPDGAIVFAVCPSGPLEPKIEQNIRNADVLTSFPAILSLRDGKYRAVGRDDLSGPGKFPVHGMQITDFVYESGNNSWLAYDHSSGELLRIRLMPK